MVIKPDRALIWDGCRNVRDLGGLPTADGRMTAFGAIVRADSVHRLTDAGWDALLAYGVRTVVDLRSGVSAGAAPSRPGVRTVAIPFGEVMPAVSPATHASAPPADALPERWIAELYLAAFARERSAVADAVAAIAGAPPGAVVIHCQIGKDRTGMVSALVLRLADVLEDAVALDYEATAISLAADVERFIGRAQDDAERRLRRHIAAAPSGAMRLVLRELGDVRGYLRSGGLTDRQLDAVAARLAG